LRREDAAGRSLVVSARPTTEAPVHRVCADYALTVCPHLRGRDADLERLPSGFSILSAIVGGPAVADDFGLQIDPARKIIGSMKLAWPASQVRWVA
jgi:hypothetical protein